jgi:hypothetical protein
MLYEIIVGNPLDDTTKSYFYLSSYSPRAVQAMDMLGIDEDDYIISIKKPRIFINAKDEKEYNELEELRKQILNP